MMKNDEVGIVSKFCKKLNEASKEQSEAGIFKRIAQIDQWLAGYRKIFAQDIPTRKLVERMINSNKELEKALEVGFGPFLSNVGGVITAWEHEVDECLATEEENDNPYNIQGLDTDLPGQYETYEPNPYDGTYSEE